MGRCREGLRAARRYPTSFAAVQKHVAVLEEAGLVSTHRRGREALEDLWRGRVAQMDQILAEDR